jgi:hypothetical protein
VIKPTIINIKKISLLFFLLFGAVHLISSALLTNNLFYKQSLIVNQTLDIPFILTGLLYAFSSIRLSFTDNEEPHKTLDIFLIAIIIAALITIISVDFIFSDK